MLQRQDDRYRYLTLELTSHQLYTGYNSSWLVYALNLDVIILPGIRHKAVGG